MSLKCIIGTLKSKAGHQYKEVQMNLKKIIGGLKLAKVLKGKDRIGKTDLGVLKVAFMVAALDGEVSGAEYEAFEAMARKCRGYTPAGAATALDEAMRSAGYLMLLSKRVSQAELVKAFLAEAKAALPNGFAYFEIEDVRRAIVTWIAMGLSDGDFSVREKACIEALRKTFAEMKVKHAEEERERAMMLSPAFRAMYSQGENVKTLELVSRVFVNRVEDVIAELGDTKDGEKALKDLVSGKV